MPPAKHKLFNGLDIGKSFNNGFQNIIAHHLLIFFIFL